MARTGGRRGELSALAAVLACVVASASCGDGGESSAEDGPATDSAETAPAEAVETAPEPDPAVPAEDGDSTPTGTEVVEDTAAPADDELADDTVPEPPPPVRVPAGTRINAAAADDISTDRYRVDDPVVVTVTHDVLGPNAELLLPRGVRLLGRVRTSIGSGGPGEPAVLEIDFETLSADRYERPIEGAVVNRPVILDPVAARRRRTASGRAAALAMVPGLIMGGTIIVVELRAPVELPPVSPGERMRLRGDSLPLPFDSVPPSDSTVRPDTTAARPRG